MKDKIKKLTIHITEDSHADLRIKLNYDKLTQANFFRFLIKEYIDDNPEFRNCLNNILLKNKKIFNSRKKVIEKDFEEYEKINKQYGLSEDELEDIFDILESENPDI